ncbi:MAG: response regulator [Archangiaceae bacterium]|nr:response regulator [Archangiaceae bacterium]
MKTRVLVVDDDAELAMMVRDVLKRAGFEPWVAGPDNAEAMFSAKTFDLLITDKNMPGLTGFELIKRLRARDPSLPVVMMTAHPELPTAGVPIQGYLAKPFNGLKSIVDVVTRTAERARELSQAHERFRRVG